MRSQLTSLFNLKNTTHSSLGLFASFDILQEFGDFVLSTSMLYIFNTKPLLLLEVLTISCN